MMGGMPFIHEGLYEGNYGGFVSSAAKSSPKAIADHVSSDKSGGMPSLHGVDGKTFGGLVSGMEPGAISSHVNGR